MDRPGAAASEPTALDPAVAIRTLERLLPERAAVRLVGSEIAALADALRAAGYRVQCQPNEERAEVLLVVETALAPVVQELDNPRSSLSADGILLLAGRLAWGESRPRDVLPASELVAGLYERGFAVLERRVLGTDVEDQDEIPPLRRDGPVRSELLVARRDGYAVRSYRPGDEAALLALFHEAFPHDDRELAHWFWKYRDHPQGGPFLSVAVGADGRIGAHYGAYPVPFLDSTGSALRTFEAFHIGDTMTARWARRVGRRRTTLVARTAQHFYHRHCAHRIGFNYGFNTGKIHRFYLRLVPGSEYLEPAAYRVLELAQRRPRPPGFLDRRVRGARVERVEAIDGEWDELFERAAPAYSLLTVRDRRQLQWRYFDRPDVDYLLLAVRRRDRLVGWGAFLRRGDALIWGDALFDPDHRAAVSALLAGALGTEEGRSAQRIEAWFPPRPAFWHATLTDLGFESRPEPNGLALIYMEFEERDLGRRLSEDLYYTMADSDLF